jgi:hypothetical protein
MNSTLSSVLGFIAGAAVGSIIVWRISKNKYEELMAKETEELREYYNNKFNGGTTVEKDSEETVNEDSEEKLTFEKLVNELGYTNYSNVPDKKDSEVDNTNKPYVIKPEEFGSKEEYERVSLTYYSDGILADELDFVIEDVEDTVGKDSLSHFGEYEDDSVFVRNDRLECDYEILLDSRKFIDVVGPTEPHGVG